MNRLLRASPVLALVGGLSSKSAICATQPQRVAVIVGANDAALGRKPLRYAHADARLMADVLKDLGGFSAPQVHLLLDPEPSAVLARLDEVLAQATPETLVVFYYSGHADAQALFTHGKPLSLRDIRQRLDADRARVRIGVIDACRGGGWTGTKGLHETEPFEVNIPLELSNEGSVLIASSSGLEDAHESEALGGSFFTHHFAAALRGAADRNGDGLVTVAEAFDYAKVLTIRDTAMQASAPQHPSFQVNLRGRQDLALATIAQGRTLVALEQTEGPLQLVHLDSGLIVLEVPPGKRTMRLAVPAGRYLLRRRVGPKVLGKEFSVRSGSVVAVSETNLEVSGQENLVAKHSEPNPTTLSTLPDGFVEFQIALGVRHETGPGVQFSGGDDQDVTGNLNIVYAFTDRLQWTLPTLAFAYRFGQSEVREWIPWGGLLGWGLGASGLMGAFFEGSLGAGLDLRQWLGSRQSITAGVGAASSFQWTERHVENIQFCSDVGCGNFPPSTWRFISSVGYSHTVADTVTFNFAVGAAHNFTYRGAAPTFGASEESFRLTLSIGSFQVRALRQHPLVQVHLSDAFSLDAHAWVTYDFAKPALSETYMGGITWTW